MKQTSLTMASVAPALSAFLAGRPKGFYAFLIETLHQSRRIQARRILQQNRHLISGSGGSNSFHQKPDLKDREIGE